VKIGSKLKIEEWLFISFAATLSFATLLQFSFLNERVQLSDSIFLAAAIVWGLAVALRRKNLRWSWFYLCLAAYAAAVILSAITSVNPAQSAVKLAGKFYLIGIAFLTFNLVTSTEFLRKILQAWLLGVSFALFFSLLGIILFYAGLKDPSQNLVLHPIFGSLPAGDYPRIEGFFYYPAMFCNFLGVSWMFAVLLVSAGWLKTRYFWLFGIALFIVNAFTITPGLGGIFLSTGYFLQKKLKQSQRLLLSRLVLAASLLVAAAFLFVASVTLFAYTPSGSRVPLTNGEFSPSHRAEAWRTAFETFLQNPITGRGVDMSVAESEYTDPSGNYQLLTDAHNTYISVLAETGLIGFLTFFGIVIFVTLNLIPRRSEDKFHKTIKFCLLLALVDAFFYQSLTGSFEDARHLWFLFGLAAAVGENNSFQTIKETQTNHRMPGANQPTS
jgi:O-antigen ligase